MNRLVLLLTILLGSIPHVDAGEFNQVLSIGDEAPGWQELIGVDGAKHSLADLSDSKVVVIVFTCNSCPYAVDVEDRLIALHTKYSDRGMALITINVNKVEEDLLPAMKEKSKSKGFQFPYLFDPSQKIAKDYGAIYTPECYVLDRQRRIVYMGSMDDSPSGNDITKRYVESAIEAVLSGAKPEITETIPIGCRVRYERERRSRKVKQE